MLKRVAIAVVAVAAVVIVGNAALAGAAKTHKNCKIDLTGLVATLKKNSGSPPVDGSVTDGGTLDGKLCGKRFRGAYRDTLTFTLPGKFKLASTSFGPDGSTRAKGTGTASLNPDGSVSIAGKGTYVGGTASGRAARGSFTFTGTEPANSNISKLHIAGTIEN
jgi:hypothetical protein